MNKELEIINSIIVKYEKAITQIRCSISKDTLLILRRHNVQYGVCAAVMMFLSEDERTEELSMACYNINGWIKSFTEGNVDFWFPVPIDCVDNKEMVLGYLQMRVDRLKLYKTK